MGHERYLLWRRSGPVHHARDVEADGLEEVSAGWTYHCLLTFHAFLSQRDPQDSLEPFMLDDERDLSPLAFVRLVRKNVRPFHRDIFPVSKPLRA